jgi:hypothetical protein
MDGGLLDGPAACLVGTEDGLRNHQQLLSALSGEGGHLSPSLMLCDPACAAAFSAFRNHAGVDGNGLWWRDAARLIRSLHGRSPLDIWALGCADGRKEVALCEWLLATGIGWLRVLLIDQSLPLLTSAFRHAWARIGGERELRLAGLQADLTEVPQVRFGRRANRQLFCLLAPQLGLIDSEILVLRRALWHAHPRDLLLLGFDVASGNPSVRTRLGARKPLLPSLDEAKADGFIDPLLKALVTRPFQLYEPKLHELRLTTSVETTGCSVPSSYAVELRGTVTAPPRNPRRYSLWRSKCYEPQALADSLLAEGWQLLRQWQDEKQTPAAGLHLYQRMHCEESCASDGPGSFAPMLGLSPQRLWPLPSELGRLVGRTVIRRRLVTLCRALSRVRCQPVAMRSRESASAVGKRIAKLACLLL